MRTRYLVLITALLAGCADSIPFAGGQLDGTLAQAPGDWSETAGAEVIQLEPRPEDPYSVKLWVVGIGPALYVHAGATRTTWIEHIDVDPSVRLQIGSTLYELTAVRVESEEEFATFADAYEVKYDLRPRNENVGEVYLYRLEARG